MRFRLWPLLLLLCAACARVASSAADAATAAPRAATRAAACSVESGALRAGARNRVRIGRSDRTFLLALPPGALAANATSSPPLPLLYVLHGYSESAEVILERTRLDALATARGFLVAAPQGDPGTIGAWSLGNAPGDGRPTDGLAHAEEEVAFLDDVADCIAGALRLPLRAGAVFVAGLSQGGKMACRFACGGGTRSGGVRVRGLALAAGVQAEAHRSCASGGRVPTLVFYGGADAVTPLCARGGFGYRPGAEDVDAWARGAAYNGCDARTPPTPLCPASMRNAAFMASPFDTVAAAAASTRVFMYDAGCAAAPLALYWLPLGIHEWPDALPGVGATASEVALAFFEALASGAAPARSSVMTPRGDFAPCAARRPCAGRLGAGQPGQLW
jgi:poly(3-hydroxybutyrate) depolymerase